METNLHLLCAHHHQLKTAGLFQVERDVRTGQTTWHAPTGHMYIRGPEPADLVALEAHLRADLDANRCTQRYARTQTKRVRSAAQLAAASEAWSNPFLAGVDWIDPMSPPRTRGSRSAQRSRSSSRSQPPARARCPEHAHSATASAWPEAEPPF
ncbi:hypothetical protein [Ruania albidiflava]|uniref:hypothetical protein n=1 Tax=Ruania albidiflava TaxID=366586 RepID=UPI0023F462BB|nr:hypothetical protein [Ruania albidiflava]